jgi:hypothetical protein
MTYFAGGSIEGLADVIFGHIKFVFHDAEEVNFHALLIFT